LAKEGRLVELGLMLAESRISRTKRNILI